ncbi:DNA-binding protein [Xanthomonas euvesicatoria pv. eucalypti]|uniref:DNA-binding protein n=1 Tax=Xanthomonas euvesicatoria TaxID=456327 RepID=UPI0026E43F4F|nr:DNA-binding protein [Xanthomonas euvesicatoria]MDO7931557.1 DNA-binding protein [Xanthomonas euvesicatoria pv. eucalypti]MDO7935716.1 DNA-binding protein [Xanthomonas euvesicatoria pv. eucalypti]MDO7940084.1 DNA-binding protein [Xanthomonas euvesicatoria pv. eucalypti]MDO7944563.1 DNA-binding protein [Xanthomonas euvesicatoria pv. eucalypti]MDO7951965.1 DNA-binding protein [Xanthomonas euvesicatoria pv. eucalypti]
MAQTPSLRPEEAYEAIESLVAEGLPPTHLAVRDRVGGRGSHPVISRYISDWYSKNGPTFAAKVVAARQHDPVADVVAQMKQAGVEAAKIVSDEERKRREALERREEQLQETQLALDMRERSLLEQSEKLADREASVERLIAELRADKASLSDQLQQTQSEVGRLNAELHRAHEAHAASRLEADASREKLLAQVASLEVRVAELAAREQSAKQAAEAAREAEQKALDALSAWNESEQVHRQMANAAVERVAALNTQLSGAFRTDLERIMTASSSREQAKAAELRAALQELNAAKEKIAGLETRSELLAEVQANLSAAKAERDMAQATVRELVASLGELAKPRMDDAAPS